MRTFLSRLLHWPPESPGAVRGLESPSKPQPDASQARSHLDALPPVFQPCMGKREQGHLPPLFQVLAGY